MLIVGVLVFFLSPSLPPTPFSPLIDWWAHTRPIVYCYDLSLVSRSQSSTLHTHTHTHTTHTYTHTQTHTTYTHTHTHTCTPHTFLGCLVQDDISTFTFTFSHLADAFIQSDLHMCNLQCTHFTFNIYTDGTLHIRSN